MAAVILNSWQGSGAPPAGGGRNMTGIAHDIVANLSVDTSLLASGNIDMIAQEVPWEWTDPTLQNPGADGTRRLGQQDFSAAGYKFQGANGGFGQSSATLKLDANIRAAALLGVYTVLGASAGTDMPLWLTGEPPGTPGGDFQPAGIFGVMGANVMNLVFSNSQGTGTARRFYYPMLWGPGLTTYLLYLGRWIDAMAAHWQTQFVAGASGATLYDFIVAYRTAGMNRGTEELRAPANWPAVLIGTTHGLGTADCVTPGVSISPEAIMAAGGTPKLLNVAWDAIVDLWRAAFPGRITQMAPTSPSTRDSAFPPLNPITGNFPVCAVDIAATQAANAGSSASNVPVIVLDANSFPAGRSFADIPDPALLGGPQRMFFPVNAGGGAQLDQLQYTSVDLATLQVRGLTGGNAGHQLLGPLPISGAAASTFGSVQLAVAASAVWPDGVLVMIRNVVGTGGFDTAVNGKVFTARRISAGQWSLTRPDATPLPMVGAWVSGGSFVAVAANAFGDLAGDTTNTDQTTAAMYLSAVGRVPRGQLIVLHNSIQAPPPPPGIADLPVSTGTGDGILGDDQPGLLYIAQQPYGTMIGGQQDNAAYGQPSIWAATTASSPSGGTVATNTVPVGNGQGGQVWPSTTVPFKVCVTDPSGLAQVTTAIAAALSGATVLTTTAAVKFANGARVSHAPSILPSATAATGYVPPLRYLETFWNVNNDPDLAAAHALFVALFGA